jgi:hypothetical protein
VLFDENRRLFQAVLTKLYSQKEVEIRVDPGRTFHAVFTNARPLKTEFALREATEALLDDVKIDLLLVIAETGEWLLEAGIKERLNDRKIAIIIADGIHRSRLCQLGRVITRDLYWHQHNRHLTVGVDRHDRPVGAIYFTRRLRSGDIVPLRLDAKDSRVALQVFAAYWAKATGQGGDTWLQESQYDPARVLQDIRGRLAVDGSRIPNAYSGSDGA